MRKGYKEDDIRKILGGNLLRVMEQTEKVSRKCIDRTKSSKLRNQPLAGRQLLPKGITEGLPAIRP